MHMCLQVCAHTCAYVYFSPHYDVMINLYYNNSSSNNNNHHHHLNQVYLVGIVQ